MIADFFYIEQEQPSEILENSHRIIIGIPKENQKKETRIGLTPLSCKNLIENGFAIKIQTGAGAKANYQDYQYSEVGCLIVESKEEAFDCDILLKIQPVSIEECKYVKHHQTIISFLNINEQNPQVLHNLIKKKVTAVAMEYIKNNKDFYPIMYSMQEINGKASMMVANDLLSSLQGGKGALLGGIMGISPASVVIIGTSTAALKATEVALSLGCQVKVFDDDIYNLTTFSQKLKENVYTSVLNMDMLQKALKSADVVIGAKSINCHSYPIVSQEMIGLMKKDSVIIDLNVEMGSAFETCKPCTLENPCYKYKNILHFCLNNLSVMYPRTASIAISNVLVNIIYQLKSAIKDINQTYYMEEVRSSIYLIGSVVTNKKIAKKFNLEYRDIDLLFL